MGEGDGANQVGECRDELQAPDDRWRPDGDVAVTGDPRPVPRDAGEVDWPVLSRHAGPVPNHPPRAPLGRMERLHPETDNRASLGDWIRVQPGEAASGFLTGPVASSPRLLDVVRIERHPQHPRGRRHGRLGREIAGNRLRQIRFQDRDQALVSPKHEAVLFVLHYPIAVDDAGVLEPKGCHDRSLGASETPRPRSAASHPASSYKTHGRTLIDPRSRLGGNAEASRMGLDSQGPRPVSRVVAPCTPPFRS